MSEYPPNSYTAKAAPPVEPDKKIEKVVVGEVTRRKPTLGERFKTTFVGGDAKSVSHYIMTDVIVPTVKDLLFDIVSQGFQRTLYGDSRPANRVTAMQRMGGVANTAYNRVQQSSVIRPDPRMIPVPGRTISRVLPPFEHIVLDTRAEAEQVIQHLVELIGRYEQVTVAELYELLGIKPEYTDHQWGWQDIQNMGVSYTRGGYRLMLPQPVVLKEA